MFTPNVYIYQTRRGSSNLLGVTMNAILASKIFELSYLINELSPPTT